MIIAFISCLIVFNVAFTTQYTKSVTLYFIPDIGLCLGNILMSCYLIYHARYLENFLHSCLIKALILLGFYINLISALFYAFLPIDRLWLHLPLFDFAAGLWTEYPDILKFKVAATLHAVTFKVYADYLRDKYSY